TPPAGRCPAWIPEVTACAPAASRRRRPSRSRRRWSATSAATPRSRRSSCGQRMVGKFGAIVSLAVFCAAAQPAHADVYAGKTITVITSTGAGGTYDLVPRLIARPTPRHLAGRPIITVKNMPGGGNVLATNYMYNIAPKAGTAIATIHSAMPLHQVLDGQGVRYDADKFNWLGSTGPQNEVILVWH